MQLEQLVQWEPAGLGDELVRFDERPAQSLGQQRADRALARPAQADQGQDA